MHAVISFAAGLVLTVSNLVLIFKEGYWWLILHVEW